MSNDTLFTAEQLSEDSGPVVLGVVISFTVLATVIVTIRLYTRLHVLKRLYLDVWIILAAMLPAWVTTIVICLYVRYGLGRHTETLNASDIQNGMLVFFISSLSYNTSLFLCKLSILVSYNRIFAFTPVSLISRISMGLFTGMYIYFLVSSLIACHPVSTMWTNSPDGYCEHNFNSWFAISGANVVGDLLLFILPLPLLSRLNLDGRSKINLGFVFLCGGVVVAISAYRFSVLFDFINSPLEADFTWCGTATSIWSTVEGLVAVMSPSLLPMPAFVRHIRSKFPSSDVEDGSKQRSESQIPAISKSLETFDEKEWSGGFDNS